MGNPRYQNDGDDRTSGPGFGVTLHEDLLSVPLGWRKPRRVFVCSMADLFHPDVSEDFVARVYNTMAQAKQHQFQILTKRPQRMAQLVNGLLVLTYALFGRHVDDMEWPLPNVWNGASVESDRYSFRADHVRATSAAVRWISAEPLLGPLPSLDLSGIDWVVVGGESGPRHRPMELSWLEDLVARCRGRIPVYVKQDSGRLPGRQGRIPDDLWIHEWPGVPVGTP